MATQVLDELVVTLGLDPTKFTKGQADALAAFKRTQEVALETGTAIEKSTGEMLEFFTVAAATAKRFAFALVGITGIADFVEHIVSAGIQVDRFSRLTGMSAHELGAWRNVAEQFSGTAEGITSSFYNMQQGLEQFALTGESSAIPYYRALGVSILDAHGQLRHDMGALALELSKNPTLLAMEKTDPARAAAVLAGFGFDPATINLILQGYKKLKE